MRERAIRYLLREGASRPAGLAYRGRHSERQAQGARKGAGNAVGGLLWTLMAFPTQASIAMHVQSSGAMLVMSARDNLQNYTYPASLSLSLRILHFVLSPELAYTHTHTRDSCRPVADAFLEGLKDRACGNDGYGTRLNYRSYGEVSSLIANDRFHSRVVRSIGLRSASMGKTDTMRAADEKVDNCTGASRGSGDR